MDKLLQVRRHEKSDGEWKVHEMANCRKGTWRAEGMLNVVLTKTIIVDRLGYPSMSAHYLKIRVNY